MLAVQLDESLKIGELNVAETLNNVVVDTGIGMRRHTMGNVPGFLILGFIPEAQDKDGFTAEEAGNKYNVPLKARGENGELGLSRDTKKNPVTEKNPLRWPADFAENYDALPLIKDGKSDLYVTATGKLTTEPYTDTSRRNIKSFVLKLDKQASPKRFYRTTIKDPELVWAEDGRVRKMAIEIKANDPVTPDEMAERKTQATQKRQATTAQQIVSKDTHLLIPPLINKWLAQRKDASTIYTLLESMEFLDGLKTLQAEGKFLEIKPAD